MKKLSLKANAKEYVKYNIEHVKIYNHLGTAFYYLGMVRDRGDIVDQIEYVRLMIEEYPQLTKDFIEQKDNPWFMCSFKKETVEWLEKINLLQ